MIRQLAFTSAAILLIVACTLLPFLPGPYDGMALTLSVMAQLFGVAGLLLVPLGAIWLLHDLRTRAPQTGTRPGRDAGFWFAVVAIAASTLVALAVSLGAFITVGRSLGFVLLAFWAWVVWRMAVRLKAIRSTQPRAFNPAPLYLIVLSIAAAVLKFAVVPPAADFSRNLAIQNSASMISDIERYRATHGHYPRSLLSLWQDYRPSVIGVEQYHYEPNGDAYNLYFEQFSPMFGTREIVMYNPRGEHEMTSHDMDLLRRPAELIRGGYYAVHPAASPNWKCFLFD